MSRNLNLHSYQNIKVLAKIQPRIASSWLSLLFLKHNGQVRQSSFQFGKKYNRDQWLRFKTNALEDNKKYELACSSIDWVKQYNDYRKIIVARDPYLRVASAYFNDIRKNDYNMSFVQFVRTLRDEDNLHFNKVWEPQISYMMGTLIKETNDWEIVHIQSNDQMYRLQQSFDGMSSIGTVINNQSFYSHYNRKTYYAVLDSQSKQIIYNVYKNDFEILGYIK